MTIEKLPISVTGEKVDIVVLFADIRNFSSWLHNVSAEQAAELIQIEYEKVIQLAHDYYHTYHKFLGDGFLLIWEITDVDGFENALSLAIGAAFEIHKKYWYSSKDLRFNSPEGLGIGIACGEAVRVQPESFIKEMNEPDFVGYPMNCGARIQNLANPYGVVVDSYGALLAKKSPDHILSTASSRALHKHLLRPTENALKVAAEMKGLSDRDKTDFRYIIWPYNQDHLWETDGRL